MYQVLIRNGNMTIDVSASEGLISGNITEAVNEFASFEFSLLPISPGYDNINPLKTMVEVVNNGVQVYYGRVLTETPQMNNKGLCSKKIICEDRMAFLCDSVQPYATERQYEGAGSTNGLQEFIDVVLNNHNLQVEDYKKIYRGNVTLVTYETSEGVYKGLNFESTWETLKTKLLDVFGGELRVREQNGLLYLDYAESLGTTRNTSIEVNNNMVSVSHTLNPVNVVSRLIPLGAKKKVLITGENGEVSERETNERITIEEINDGKNYVESDLALSLYGIQYKTVVWNDVNEAQILRNRGTEYLATQNKALATYSVNAVDLSFIGEATDQFKLYDWFPVRNQDLGINNTLEVIKKSTDIFAPYNPNLTFGSKDVNLSDVIIGNIGGIANVENQLNSTQTNMSNQINAVYSYASSAASAVQQTANTLIAQVEENTVSKSTYDEFSETVRNILQMEADGTTMIFQTIFNEIETVNGIQQTNYEEIIKYIRFEDGNIILGEKNNPITLTLENDVLAFKQNGVIVAYLTNQKFYVVDGEFDNSLRIGKFKFTPRKNGNTSLVKVGV